MKVKINIRLLLLLTFFCGLTFNQVWATPFDEAPALSKKQKRAQRKQLRKQRRQARKMQRARKFLNSRVGKWLVKRMVRKAQKRLQKKHRMGRRNRSRLAKPHKGKDEDTENTLKIIFFLVIVAVFILSLVFAFILHFLLIAALVLLVLAAFPDAPGLAAILGTAFAIFLLGTTDFSSFDVGKLFRVYPPFRKGFGF